MRSSRSALLLLALLSGCREVPATVLLRIEAEAIPAPDELRLTILGPGGVEVRDRRLPVSGKPTLPDSVVLYPRAVGELRFLVRALAGGGQVAEGITQAEARSGAQVSVTVTLRAAPLPDRDGDGVPDAIDSCPDLANPAQGPCRAEAGLADGPRRDLPDGPRPDLGRDAPGQDGASKADLPKAKDLPKDQRQPDGKPRDLPRPDQRKDLPLQPDKPQPDKLQPDKLQPDKPQPDKPAAPKPLLMSDLTAIDLSHAPGLLVPGFRCKTYTFCTSSSSCIYYAENFGHLQSSETLYYDGKSYTPAQAVKFRIAGGAASQCLDPAVTLQAGEYVVITFDGGKTLNVYLPAFSGKELTIYLATDGRTYHDQALTQLAGAP